MSQYDNLSGLSLPTPSTGVQQMPDSGTSQNVPQQAAIPPQDATFSVPQTSYQQPLVPLSPPTQPQPQMSPQASVPNVPQESLDDEALDLDWINRAKAIVEQTQTDPYTESNALSQLKASYLQRRHGKEIKTSGQQ